MTEEDKERIRKILGVILLSDLNDESKLEALSIFRSGMLSRYHACDVSKVWESILIVNLRKS